MWVCNAVQTWNEYLLMIWFNNGVLTITTIDSFIVWTPPWPNPCVVEAFNEPFSPAAMMLEDATTGREQVWLLSPTGAGGAWAPTGGVWRMYPL